MPDRNAVDRSKRLGDAGFHGLVVVLLVATFVLFFLPLLVVVALSFDARTFLGPLPPSKFSWQWYERFFSSDFYLQSRRRSPR
jgi:putative spermidine/putrescine transport system permease protein